ncbi:hypothetical protein ACLB2K_049892 [Fragaria x ananassa]
MASSTIAPRAIVLELLNMDNYEHWSLRVKTYLLAEGLWKVIEAGGDPPKLEDDEEKFDAWSRKNAKALHVIHITCGSGIFPFISETTSARVAWDMLARKFLLIYYYFGKGKDARSDSPTPVYGGRRVHEENIGTEGGEATDAGHENKCANVALQEAFFGFFKNVRAVDDWDEVMEFLKRHPEAVRMRYPKNGYTGLHIAAGTGASKAVEEMVQLMEEEDLEIKDNAGPILSRVSDPDDRKSASQVCKGWRLMEGLTRSSLRVLNLDHLPQLLSRYPNLNTFETPKGMSNADLALLAQSCPKLEAIKLVAINIDEEIGTQGVSALQGLESGISADQVIEQIRVLVQVGDEAAHNLTYLDLEESFVSDQALEAIGSSSCPIRVLRLKLCAVSDAGFRFLANGSCSKTIKELNLNANLEITDVGVSLLCKMCVLEELDLGVCMKITDVGGQAISAIRTLKKLNLECVFLLTEKTFVALAENCLYLEVLRLDGGTEIPAFDAFLGHKCLRSLRLIGYMPDDFRKSTLERLALRCPSLESIVVQEDWRERLLQLMQESTASRFLQFING